MIADMFHVSAEASEGVTARADEREDGGGQ